MLYQYHVSKILTLQTIINMKHIKILIILICCFNIHQKIEAQAPTQGSYITNNTMGAFHGTWQWTNGADTVKLHLATKKVYINFNGGFFWDNLVGWHLYKRGNTIIESSIQYINNIESRTFLGGNEGQSNNNRCEGTFTDITKNKYGELTLTLNTAQNQLTWKLDVSPGLKARTSNQPPYISGFTLPENMVLTKQ